jgi:hypothetical protein
MALTTEQAQANILASNPNASASDIRRMAADAVSKSQLLDMTQAFANQQAERDEAAADARKQANTDALAGQVARDKYDRGGSDSYPNPWGIGTPDKVAETFEQSDQRRRDAQLLADARRW